MGVAAGLWSLGIAGCVAGPAQATQATGLCIAATGSNGWCGDGRAATKAKLGLPRDVAPLPGGGFLVADSVNHVIRRVGPDGRIATVAGRGTAGDPLIGRSAGRNHLGTPTAVAPLPGGGYLIADAALA
ncbi:MAG TPA: hypothetical protein VGV67_07665, partial [Solirubrobacteraceae bacterium]|nr:hypothetical protein [Solirubrobacteraceae bacterium]